MLQKIISNKKIKMFAGYLCQRCHHPFPQVLPGKTVQGTLNAIMTETHKGKTEEKKYLITIIITVYAACHWLLAVESVVLYGVQRKLSITHDVVLHMAPETEPYVVMEGEDVLLNFFPRVRP